jgi:flagellar motor switch protein FliG
MKRDDKSPDDQKPPAGAESGRRAISSPALDQRVAAYAKAMKKSAPADGSDGADVPGAAGFAKRVSAWNPPVVPRSAPADAAPAPEKPSRPDSPRPGASQPPAPRAALRSERGEAVPPETGAPEGFIKTGPAESKYRKVAKFLFLVGKEEAAKILSKLDRTQVELVAKELSTIKRVETAEAEVLLEQFRSLLSAAGERGGVDAARSLLHAAFGSEKGEAVLKKAVPEAAENPFAFLEDFEGDQVALLLKGEPAAVSSLVLSRMSPKAAAAAINAMEEAARLDVLKRIAKIGKVAPEVLERTAAALREKARQVGRQTGETVDGRSALAEILKYADSSVGDRLLEELEEDNPDLGRDIKERLFTLDDIVRVEDRAVQEKLRSMTDAEIALVLKGRRPSFAEKLLSNISAQRRALVNDERSILGPVPRSEADAAAREFLSWFRARKEEGRLVFMDDADLV